MQWRGRRESDNVDDLRGQRTSRGGAVGIGGTGLLIIVVFALLTGQNPLDLLGQIASQQGTATTSDSGGPPHQEPAPSAGGRGQRAVLPGGLAGPEDGWPRGFPA